MKDIVSPIKNSLDIWVAFLTRHDLLDKDHLPAVLNTPTLKKALSVLDIMNFGKEEREAYEDHLKWMRIEANTLKKYQSKGFEEGKIEGEAKGRAERNIEVARSLLRKGFSLKDITEVTGLDEDQLTRIVKNTQNY